MISSCTTRLRLDLGSPSSRALSLFHFVSTRSSDGHTVPMHWISSELKRRQLQAFMLSENVCKDTSHVVPHDGIRPLLSCLSEKSPVKMWFRRLRWRPLLGSTRRRVVLNFAKIPSAPFHGVLELDYQFLCFLARHGTHDRMFCLCRLLGAKPKSRWILAAAGAHIFTPLHNVTPATKVPIEGCVALVRSWTHDQYHHEFLR